MSSPPPSTSASLFTICSTCDVCTGSCIGDRSIESLVAAAMMSTSSSRCDGLYIPAIALPSLCVLLVSSTSKIAADPRDGLSLCVDLRQPSRFQLLQCAPPSDRLSFSSGIFPSDKPTRPLLDAEDSAQGARACKPIASAASWLRRSLSCRFGLGIK